MVKFDTESSFTKYMTNQFTTKGGLVIPLIGMSPMQQQGLPDRIYSHLTFGTLFIEFKKDSNTPSGSQFAVIHDLCLRGSKACWCRYVSGLELVEFYIPNYNKVGSQLVAVESPESLQTKMLIVLQDICKRIATSYNHIHLQ